MVELDDSHRKTQRWQARRQPWGPRWRTSKPIRYTHGYTPGCPCAIQMEGGHKLWHVLALWVASVFEYLTLGRELVAGFDTLWGSSEFNQKIFSTVGRRFDISMTFVWSVQNHIGSTLVPIWLSPGKLSLLRQHPSVNIVSIVFLDLLL